MTVRAGRSSMWAGVLALAASLTGCGADEIRHCISQPPNFQSDGPGYELIDVFNGEVWATRDWTPDAFEAFPVRRSLGLWIKSDPRELATTAEARFLRSPGCKADGEYSYRHLADRDFLHVVDLHKRPTHLGPGLRRIELVKHHVLSFPAFNPVQFLVSPAGERFVEVSRTFDRGKEPTLPAGWRVEEKIPFESFTVSLTGHVSVIRLDNEDSFQGPIPSDLEIR